MRGLVNRRIRELRDWLLGYLRISAYDLSTPALRYACEALIKFKPRYIYGYRVALDLFARANLDRADELRSLGIKCVQASAEAFPSHDSKDILFHLFNCPIAMEYGSMETGPMAGTIQRSNAYSVYWRDFLLEAIPLDAGNFRLLVTTLYPRATPLFRYEIGDTVVAPLGVRVTEGRVLGVHSFKEIGGRCNLSVVLMDGKRVHSEVFSHAVKEIPNFGPFQVV